MVTGRQGRHPLLYVHPFLHSIISSSQLSPQHRNHFVLKLAPALENTCQGGKQMRCTKVPIDLYTIACCFELGRIYLTLVAQGVQLGRGHQSWRQTLKISRKHW